jgi:hypothetical protein
VPDCRQDQLRASTGINRTRRDEVSDQGIQAVPGCATAVVLCFLILGSIDWVAWLALQSAGSDARAAIVGCLSTLALALVRVCVVVVREVRKEHGSIEGPGEVSQEK